MGYNQSKRGGEATEKHNLWEYHNQCITKKTCWAFIQKKKKYIFEKKHQLVRAFSTSIPSQNVGNFFVSNPEGTDRVEIRRFFSIIGSDDHVSLFDVHLLGT